MGLDFGLICLGDKFNAEEIDDAVAQLLSVSTFLSYEGSMFQFGIGLVSVWVLPGLWLKIPLTESSFCQFLHQVSGPYIVHPLDHLIHI